MKAGKEMLIRLISSVVILLIFAVATGYMAQK